MDVGCAIIGTIEPHKSMLFLLVCELILFLSVLNLDWCDRELLFKFFLDLITQLSNLINHVQGHGQWLVLLRSEADQFTTHGIRALGFLDKIQVWLHQIFI